MRCFKAIFKSSAVMVIYFILILWIHIFSADLPEERMELIFISVFLKIVKNFYFIAVSLEVCPYIPVDRYNNLASQILCHSQNVNGCHFVLHTDRVLTKRTKCNINIIILSVFCNKWKNGNLRNDKCFHLVSLPDSLLLYHPYQLGKHLSVLLCLVL